MALAVTGSAQVRGRHTSQGGLEHWRELFPLLHPSVGLSCADPDPFPLPKDTWRPDSPVLSWCTKLCSKQQAVRQKPKPLAVSPMVSFLGKPIGGGSQSLTFAALRPGIFRIFLPLLLSCCLAPRRGRGLCAPLHTNAPTYAHAESQTRVCMHTQADTVTGTCMHTHTQSLLCRILQHTSRGR